MVLIMLQAFMHNFGFIRVIFMQKMPHGVEGHLPKNVNKIMNIAESDRELKIARKAVQG